MIMRKLIGFIVAVILAVTMSAPALKTLANNPQVRRQQPQSKSNKQTTRDEELMQLVRRAAEAAEAAQEEARRARQQTEKLQLQLEKTTSELAELKQRLRESPIADYGLRIADLENDVGKLQGAISKSTNAADSASGNSPLTIKQSTPDSTAQAVGNAAPLRTGQSVDGQPDQTNNNPQSAIRNPQLDARLLNLEEQTEINAAQIKEQAQTKVESDSRFRIKLSGMILANTYLNTADSGVRSSPTRAPSPASPFASSRRSVGATLRQTMIGLAMEGPRVGGARITAEGEFDFYAISSDDFRGSTLGALRLRTASARLDWEKTALTVGLRPAMISPLNPNSLASVWYPALSGAGNLWQWRPQFILEHRPRLNDSSELVLQGGLMTPFGETLDSTVIEGKPIYQGRAAYRRTLGIDRRFEAGIGGQAGRQNFSFNRNLTTYVISSDWLVPVGERLELSGEAYFGRANNLGEQSGVRADAYYLLSGPIDNPATTIRGVHAFGGWAQLNLKARRDLDFNLAFGIEDPRNQDIRSDSNFSRRGISPYFKNQAGSANFIYQLRPNFLISLEYRRIWTEYTSGRRRNDHYNLAFGYLF